MNKPILTFFALFLSIAAVAQEGPSKEDTILWLHQKIGSIEINYEIPEEDFEYNEISDSTYIGFTEDDTTIEIKRAYFSHRKSKSGDYFYYKQDRTASAKLSALSSHVKKSESEESEYLKDYIVITLSCSSKRCFKFVTRLRSTGNEGISVNDGSLKELELKIPRTIADRVQKALSHLITLSGGKEEVSEDLF